jgi:predicted ATPase
MAGFLGDNRVNPFFSNVLSSLKKIGSFGMSYGDMVVKNSQAVGTTEAMFLDKGGVLDENTLYSIKKTDTTSKQYIAYFDKDYPNKKTYLRSFSLNPEIEFILDTVCDESIVYDDKNFFSYFINTDIRGIGTEKEQKLHERFKEIYNLFGFNEGISAWHYFRQFLVDGILSFEIIFDSKGKNIIGFKELDPASLLPSVEKDLEGNFIECWIQYPDNPAMTRKLYDSQIIYISYAKGNTITRLSYVERLIRSFNLLRIMEHTRIIWNVMNSSYRMTMTVTIGTKSPQKAKQSLAELLSIYKEDIRLDSDSGELFINGRPNIQFFKNYLMPSTPNGTPDITPLTGSGDATPFTDLKALAYFSDKLKLDSKIPYSRFDREDRGTMGTYSGNAEGLDQEEIRFGKFVTRLRSIFQDILLKPLWIQFSLDYPEFGKDFMVKSQFGLDYVKDNNFAEVRYMEILNARKEQVNKIAGLQNSEGQPYFSLRYVLDKYLGMTDDDKVANQRAKEAAAKKKAEAEKEEANKGEAEGEETEPAEGGEDGEEKKDSFTL